MPLVKIKNFKAVIGKKPFFDEPVKNKQKPYEFVKNLSKYKEMMTMQQKSY